MSDGPARATASGEMRLSKAPDPLIGRVINDRFRIVSMIARGGMGKVYRAEQAPLGRAVALKVLNPNYNGDNDPEFHKRFFLEASTCSKLSHPNTVTIFDYGRTDDDVYYIAMELLEGRTLHRTLRDDGPLPFERASHVARQICRSLREAHKQGVIHRDLKPANVFLVKHGDESDFVKVLDFGLVKDIAETGEDLTQTGLFMGSPKYMSPEQIRGEKVDGRADIYALGVILYEMLTGKVPFDRPSSVNILMAHVHEPPPPLREVNPNVEVPVALEQIVMKAMAKDPEARFASMDELLGALKTNAIDAGYSVTHSGDVRMTGEHPAFTASFPPVAILPEIKSAPPPALAAHEPEAKRGAQTALLVALGALVLIGGVALAALLSGSDEEAPPIAPSPASSLPAVAVEPATRTAPALPEVVSTMVVLRSTPLGARVRVGDHALGATPADVEWTGDEAVRGRQVTFVFELEGYRDYSVTRVITSDRLEVTAELEPLPPSAPRPTIRAPRPRPRPAPRDEPVGPIKGYKLDPY